MNNWKRLIQREMAKHGESWGDIEISSRRESDLLSPFDSGHKPQAEGCAFTIWTASRVYFPAVYDGKEWCASVSRNPDAVHTDHVGGE